MGPEFDQLRLALYSPNKYDILYSVFGVWLTPLTLSYT